MDYDLCLKAPWIIPVEPRGQVLRGHAILVRGGRIAAIVPQADVPAAVHTVDLPGHVVLPGLVNAHTHAAMTLFRGLADDLPLQQWLNDHIWPAEGRHVNGDFARDGSALAALEMIRGGTTCFADMYFFADETARAAASAGLRAALGLVVIDVPTAWARDPEEYLSRGVALCDKWRHEPLITPLLAPHAPYSVSDDTLTRIRVRADEQDIALHMHIHETAGEITQSLRTYGMRPLARLDRLGLIHANLMAVHMTELDADEIVLCAERGVSVVHCPESNLKIAAGICPVASLVRAGINVALGTDGAASNNDLDMFGEMRTAALLAKGTSRDATAIPAAVALEMATLNGARALGLGDDIGSLIPGKSADMIAVDLRAPATSPVYDPISQLVYAAGRDQVTHVFVAGRALLRDRCVLTLDEPSIMSRAAAWRDRIYACDQGGMS